MPEGWRAKWIWISEAEEDARNVYVYARKVFEAPGDIDSAFLRITADARYVLFVNGQRVGNGPIRGWQSSWFYDVYDVKPYLKPGAKNAIAVIVWQPGESNFQYPLGRGGLLAQLDVKTESGREVTVATDRTWKVAASPAYDRRTPRISCQQGFVEHYDSSKDPEWKSSDFDDSSWQNAVEIGDAAADPWTSLRERPIPFLTSEPVYPARVLRARLVKPPEAVFSFDVRRSLALKDRSSNRISVAALALTVVRAPEAKEVKVVGSIPYWGGQLRVRVNGEDAPVEGGLARLKLKKGDNLVVFDISGSYHDWWFTTVWDGDGLEFRNPLGERETPWAVAGPFGSSEDLDFKKVWDAKTPEEVREAPSVRPVKLEHAASDHVAAKVAFAKEIPGKPAVEDVEYLCAPNENVAVVRPPESGDVEVLIDFGREVVGFIDFAVEAPEGVVLDFYGFEAVHPREDGGFEIQHTFGLLNNVLRYVTREGWQSYTSVVRRGFRYLILTVRFPKGEKRPVRIKYVRCLLNTYPYEEVGEFACSDWKLNRIWEVCRYTLRLCSEDTFVDCPAYEQTFWVGDARHEALVAYATYGGYALARRCWLLAGESLSRSPLVESHAPSGWQNVLTAWALLWVWACEEYYRYAGDGEFLKEIYPYVSKQMRNIAEKFIRGDGLFEIEAWNMLDWAPMDTPSRGVVAHQNAMLVEAYRRAARMARLVGREDEAEEFERIAERVKQAVNRLLWDERRKAYVDALYPDGARSKVFSLQTQTMIYLCGVAEGERREIVRKHLYEWPEDFVKFGSPFALGFLLEAYARDGEIQKALDVIRREWGAMLDYGATTVWETLTPRTRSHCHAWGALPAFILSGYVLGVRPRGTVADGVVVAPEPADLTWARGRFPTPKGAVEVRWSRGGRSFKLWVQLPEGLEGEAVLPSLVPPTAKVDARADARLLEAVFEEGRWKVKMPAGSRVCIEASW
jgi:hypothetical protein